MSVTNGPGLRDLIAPGIEVLFVGFNPGLRSAQRGHHYAGPGNQFWRLLAAAGLTPRLLRPDEDGLIVRWGLGSTNLVARPTTSAAELAQAELRAGAARLHRVVAACGPKIVAYTGKGVYLPASRRNRADWGAQPSSVFDGVTDFVLPSPSGLARLPFAEKLHWYRDLASLLAAQRDVADPWPGRRLGIRRRS